MFASRRQIRVAAFCLFLTAVCIGSLPFPTTRSAAASSFSTQNTEFFETRIRPVLATSCYACHTDSAKSDLRVDSREALLKGGRRGPAIIPGNAEKSLLIEAITHRHETLRMPKGGDKLSQQQIADLSQWINEGALWPAEAATVKSGREYIISTQQKSFWSFQPIRNPSVPTVRNTALVRNSIDAFLLAKLEEKNLRFNPIADKRTLIRRATFDLTGLPPASAEIEAFIADNSPNAFEKVIDRLLASPRYGERQARHWLDLARYADVLGAADFINGIQSWFPYSYTYRDWVIRVFNEDLPYDQFVRQQLAADRLTNNDPRHLAALGFLTLGRGGLGVSKEDRVDDQIDVVTRGLMGLSVSCARCHNHKFDPIPTRDYYALYSVFENSHQPETLPLLNPLAADREKEAALQAETARIDREIAEYKEKRYPELKAIYRTADEITRYLLATHEARELSEETELRKLAQEKDYNLYMLRRWQKSLNEPASRPIWAVWQALTKISDGEFAAKAAGAVSSAAASQKINPLVVTAFAAVPSSLREAAERYGRLLAQYDKPEPFANADEEALRQMLHHADAPPSVPFSEYNEIRLVPDGAFEREQKRKIDKLVLTQAYENAPPRAMALEDAAELRPGVIFVRGNPNNKGDQVARQFLQILAGENRQPFTQGSGRLELAQAITSKDNPLTARVIVNRLWQQHFGKGIVASASDFGTRGERPSHPELLDYLARNFIENGWSVKKLHKLLMLSHAYQQSSADNQTARAADPENRLRWRAGRRRLDFEEMRDALLTVSGSLDQTMGGLPVSATAWPFTHRRTIYSFIDRVSLPNDFRNFDFASPDTHSAQRYLTTVPQQALFMMNSPFVIEQAQAILRRSEIAAEKNSRQKIQRLYRLIFGRAATQDEVSFSLKFIESENSAIPREAETANKCNDWQYGQGEYDEEAKRVKSFMQHRYFVNGHWRASPIPGDPRIVTAQVTDKGGLPAGKTRAAIRRWIAPFDGTISITGQLEHSFGGEGLTLDGVQSWIVSDRNGTHGHWTAFRSRAETRVDRIEVKRGDTIDFVTDGRKNGSADEFTWRVTIERTDGNSKMQWNSVADFLRPARQPLTAWERYAQTLLSTVEFIVID